MVLLVSKTEWVSGVAQVPRRYPAGALSGVVEKLAY